MGLIFKDDLYYSDYITSGRELEWSEGLQSMRSEVEDAPFFIKELLEEFISSYMRDEFRYDGATLVPERYKNTRFEVASFIHDGFNGLGYLGDNVDYIFDMSMRLLGYNRFTRVCRMKLLTLGTPLNIIRRKYLGKILGGLTYTGDIELSDYIS